ncbi:MAG TPA: hypothetical protein VFW02_05490 [Candidatus Limnocylindrales bacterium]|nr:hypothetical protein [Candidatus Limnocylindrales bacterium]
MSDRPSPAQPPADTDTANPEPVAPMAPVLALDDPRTLQILSTEHWSLLGARSLAYNEAFVRGGMFLTFLSMSFVALALLAQGMSFGDEFLAVAAVLLAFDLVVGLTTYARIIGANYDDLRAVHGMARIRHAYAEIAPIAAPYFTTPTHDDARSVLSTYGAIPDTRAGSIFYGFTTSGGMIGLITAMVGGVMVSALALLAGLTGVLAVWVGIAGGIVMLILLVVFTFGSVPRQQASLSAAFPAPDRRQDGDGEMDAG